MTDILLLNIQEGTGGLSQVNFVIWLSITTPYPNPSATSAYQAITTDPNTSNFLTQLQAGTLIEEVHQLLLPTALIASSFPTVESVFLAVLNARKAYRAGTAPALPDPGLKYKVFHDSVTGWSA